MAERMIPLPIGETHVNGNHKTPYPFQEKDIVFSMQHHTLNASETGIGKSLIAIEAVLRHWQSGSTGPALVLCNKRAKEQWKQFILDQDPDAVIFVTGKSGRWPTDTKVKLRDLFHPRHNAWIIAHHAALSLPRDAEIRAARAYRAPDEWRQYIWEWIIVDEAHRYKGKRSTRAIWLRTLDGLVKHGCSGTAIDKKPTEFWNVLNWMYPERFPSFWDFQKYYIGYDDKPRNLDVLARELAPVCIRRSKSDPDVAPDLPPLIQEYVPVPFGDGSVQALIYSKVANADDIEIRFVDGVPEWQLLVPNVLAKIVRLQQILTDARLLGMEAETCKLDYVREYLEDNPDDPMIVFTKFRDVAIHLAEEFKGALVVGGDSQEGLDDWLAGKKRLLFGTIASMGESLNLQRASTAIFVDHEWSTTKMKQAYDRIHRIDIKEPKLLIHLHVPGTVDDMVLNTLQEKWTMQDMIWGFLKEHSSAIRDNA